MFQKDVSTKLPNYSHLSPKNHLRIHMKTKCDDKSAKKRYFFSSKIAFIAILIYTIVYILFV